MDEVDQVIFDNFRRLRIPELYEFIPSSSSVQPISGPTNGSSNASEPPPDTTPESGALNQHSINGNKYILAPLYNGRSPILTTGHTASRGPATAEARAEPTATDFAIGDKISADTPHLVSSSNELGANARTQSSTGTNQPGRSTSASSQEMANMGMIPQQRPPRSTRRRRSPIVESSRRAGGVPGLLVPRPLESDYHDPGPGVIGLNR
jgi:hypothetical protein